MTTIYKKRGRVSFLVEVERDRCLIYRSDNPEPLAAIVVIENYPVQIEINGDVEIVRGEWRRVKMKQLRRKAGRR